MFLIDKALLTKTQSHGRWFLPSLHKSEQTKSSLKDFNCSPKCYSELHFSSIHAYFKTLAVLFYLLLPFPKAPGNIKLRVIKYQYLLTKPKKKFFLSGILMNWNLLGPSLWCFQKHQKIRLVINIISAAWSCLILQHIQKMQHTIPRWPLPCFYSFFFNFVFKPDLHFSFQAICLSPTLPHPLINSPEELSSADLFPLPEGNCINSFLPYHNTTQHTA